MLDLSPAIKAVCPNLSAVDVANWNQALQGPMERNEINTPRRAGAFIGQCAIESSGFRDLIEDLYYSASRLTVVWPTRFRTTTDAIPYACHPEALGNYVYGNRMGNGPPASGDGYMFRGRGLIQTTGRDAYAQLAHAFGRTPQDMATWMESYAGAAEAACWNWNALRCNMYADQWELTNLSRRINGGLTQLQDRVNACNKAWQAIQAGMPPDGNVIPMVPPSPSPSPPQPTTAQPTADQLMAQEDVSLGINPNPTTEST